MTCVLSASKSLGVLGDIGLVVERFRNDNVKHGIEERHVAARREAQRLVGIGAQRLTAWIDDNDLGALLGSLLEEGCRDRMRFTVGLQPVRSTTSDCNACMKDVVTAPEPMHSISAAIELA